MRLFLHWIGLDNSAGTLYLFWSGIGGDLFIFGGIVALYQKHNCHAEHCWRIGKHMHDGSPFCTKHNPKFKDIS